MGGRAGGHRGSCRGPPPSILGIAYSPSQTEFHWIHLAQYAIVSTQCMQTSCNPSVSPSGIKREAALSLVPITSSAIASIRCTLSFVAVVFCRHRYGRRGSPEMASLAADLATAREASRRQQLRLTDQTTLFDRLARDMSDLRLANKALQASGAPSQQWGSTAS